MERSSAILYGAERKVQDYQLLLKRLDKAGFDEEGTAFVSRSLANTSLWEALTENELLHLAALAQQHGLHEQSLSIFSWLNENRPACEHGWLEHLELLSLLGLREQMATVMSRGAPHVGTERLQPFKAMTASSNEQDGEESTLGLGPFTELRREQDNLSRFLRLFRGREEVFARQWADREQEKQGYVPVNRPITEEDIKKHIAGHRTYGIYLLDEASQVWVGVIDVDLISRLRNPEQRRQSRDLIRREAVYLYKRIVELSAEAGLACICESSGGKGYHYWFPVSEPIEAAVMKKALTGLVKNLVDDVKCFGFEIFPKQEKLSGKGYGNLVKLPLGIHRGTGKRSRLFATAGDKLEDQFALLRAFSPSPAEAFLKLAEKHGKARVMVHPRHAEWAEQYPELATLLSRCAPLGQLISLARSGKSLAVREEKVLLGVLAHAGRGRLLLHHLLSRSPEYNRPLLDYRISRVRGTVLGCKRIHSLLDGHNAELPCRFDKGQYPHPLLHLPEQQDEPTLPISEKATNLQDALLCLGTAIEQVRRYL